MRTRWICLALGLALGCGGDRSEATGPEGIDIVGSYRLQTIDGKPLPVIGTVGASSGVQITDDLLRFSSDQTYTELGHYLETFGDGTVVSSSATDAGVYLSSIRLVHLRSASGSSIIGALNGGAFTLKTPDGVVYVYQRN